MDMKIIQILFKVGNVFALTPGLLTNHKTRISEKIYIIIIFLLLAIGSMITFLYRWSMYLHLPATKFVLKLIIDAVFVCHTYTSRIGVMLLKRQYLIRLIKNLKTVESNSKSRNPYFLSYIIVEVINMLRICLFHYICFTSHGWYYLRMYIIDYFQSYSMSFYIFFGYVILRMLLLRYRNLKTKLEIRVYNLTINNSSVLIDLQNIKQKLFILRQTIDYFNSIFGWSILTFIFYGVASNLLYLDGIIKHEDLPNQTTTWVIIYHTYYLLKLTTFWIGFTTICILCDYISNEFNEILNLAHKLDVLIKKNHLEETQIVSNFISAVLEYRPNFTAARFFEIDRSTIFSVLNAITTFLLVLIQFEPV